MKTDPWGLYVHIPFCIRKCVYCDFLSFPRDKMAEQGYFDVLSGEIAEKARLYGERLFDSIYIGGGTPSCVDARAVAALLQQIRRTFRIASDAEITLEANPGTVDAEKIRIYRDAGVNRFSLGVQSLSDRLLKSLGRIHDAAAVIRTVELLKKSGVENFNLDLIVGIPGIQKEAPQTLSEAQKAAAFASSCGASHISLYSMITEPDTSLWQYTQEGRVTECPEETEREMYHGVRAFLQERGFEQYEISNFALKGRESRHNLKYWNGTPYLGLGLGSASCLPGSDGIRIRSTNARSFDAYFRGETEETEYLSAEEQQKEFMMLGFRLLKGPDENRYRELFSTELRKDFAPVLLSLQQRNLIRSDLSLTEHGLDFANEIFREFV